MFFILLFLKMHTKVFREKVKWFSGICFKISNQKKKFFFKCVREKQYGKILMIVETGYLHFENFRKSWKQF